MLSLIIEFFKNNKNFEYRRWFLVLVIIIIFLIVCFSAYKTYILLLTKETSSDDYTYIQTLWTICGAGLGVLALIKFNKIINPEMLINRSHGPVYVNFKDEVFYSEVTFQVRNGGNKSFNRDDYIYYTLLIPEEIFDSMIYIKKNDEGNLFGPKESSRRVVDSYKTFDGLVKDTIHPERIIEQFKVKFKFSRSGVYIVKYFFSTENGYVPRGFKMGKPSTFGEIEVFVSKIES